MTDDVEWLTYKDLANRLGISVDGARMKARRANWVMTTTRANDGTVHVGVPISEIAKANVPRRTAKVVRRQLVQGERSPERSPEPVVPMLPAVLVDEMRRQIERMEAELASERAGRAADRAEARAERERLVETIERLVAAARPVERPGLVERLVGWLSRRPPSGGR